MAVTAISVLGVDLGKNLCSVVGLDAAGAVVMRRKVRRETLIGLAEKLPPCTVGMEACCGAHHLGRLFAACGHDVRLMSPEYVRPYVKAQKNDDRDAEGIAEAATRPTMRFVELKSQDQLDMTQPPTELPPAPVCTVQPVIQELDGHDIGDILAGTIGTWSGDLTYAYAWKRGADVIAGETLRVYTITAADVGFLVGYSVTGTNMGGSTVADADPVGPVVPAAPRSKAKARK